MERLDLERLNLPNTSGVYRFFDARKKLLYIGKATNLRDRVRSYFASDIAKTRGPLIVKMLEEARSIEWVETDSVLEALLLENRLIKEKQPPYNTKEKDNKSYNYIGITNEEFPRVLLVRGRELETKKLINYKTTFGPFPYGAKLKVALKIIRKIFPYRDTCTPCPKGVFGHTCKPCFNRQIGLCPGVCAGEVDARQYKQTIRHIELFLNGDKPRLLKSIERDMKSAAKRNDFETAARMRNQLHALQHINDVALISSDEQRGEASLFSVQRIEAYDVAHLSETARVGVMVVIENGIPKKSEYRLFNIKTKEQGDLAALSELLERRLVHIEWPQPQLFVVDGGKLQLQVATAIMQKYGHTMSICAVVKDEKHKPRDILCDKNGNEGKALTTFPKKDILLANAEAHRFAITAHRKKLRKDRLI